MGLGQCLVSLSVLRIEDMSHEYGIVKMDFRQEGLDSSLRVSELHIRFEMTGGPICSLNECMKKSVESLITTC